MAANGVDPADEMRKEIESLKAKVVELEDKLSKVSVTDEELKTYRKVAAIFARQAGLPEGVRDVKAAASGEVFGGGYAVIERHPHHIGHLIHCNTTQGRAVLIPTIIGSGFGDLGF